VGDVVVVVAVAVAVRRPYLRGHFVS